MPSHSRPPINTHRFETGDPSYIEGLWEHNVMCIINCVILCFNFQHKQQLALVLKSFDQMYVTDYGIIYRSAVGLCHSCSDHESIIIFTLFFFPISS